MSTYLLAVSPKSNHPCPLSPTICSFIPFRSKQDKPNPQSSNSLLCDMKCTWLWNTGESQRIKIINHFTQLKADICFIQETHLTNSELQYRRFKQFDKILSSTLDSKQRDISIVVNTNIPSAILNLLLIHREDLSSLLHLSSFLVNKNSSSVTQLKTQLETTTHKKTQYIIQQIKYGNVQYSNKSSKYLLIYCN